MRDIDRLLRRDFTGQAVADPCDVIFAGLADHRHEERVAPLAAIMADAGAPSYDRLLACYALAGWGERAGYAMVVESARRPRSAPWYGCSVDGRYPVDDTFSWFATAIDISDDISAVKDTRTDRVEALRALVRIADTEYFDGRLDLAIGEEELRAVAADVVETVTRGIRALEDVVVGRLPGFPVVLQLVDLASVLTETAEPEAIGLAHRLLALDHAPTTLRHAVGFVTRGSGAESRTFGEYLMHIGNDQVRADVLAAPDFRNRWAEGAGGPG